jgi:glyoxylase-like metal-dependent hydrolase (beta-lactamase superfamily II)
VHATNPAQFDDAMADRVPAPDEVRPGIWSIPLPMQQPGNPFSLCYLISGDDGSLHLIDTGYDGDENWRMFGDALDRFGLSLADIASVFVTHLHPDHLGMTERLRAATGARIGMLRREQQGLAAVAAGGLTPPTGLLEGWGVPPERRAELSIPLGADLVAHGIPTIDRAFEPGETLDVPGREIEALWTPGHTAGSASLVDRDAGLLYTGDTVLPKIFSGLGLGDREETGSGAANPIADYLASLTSLARFDDLEVAPGHGYRFRGLIERNAQLAEHHLHRSRAAAAVIRDDPHATVWQVASRLRWTVGWQNLRSFYLLSALSQTVLHLDFGRAHPDVLVE